MSLPQDAFISVFFVSHCQVAFVNVLFAFSFYFFGEGRGPESQSRVMTYIPIISLTLFSKLFLKVDKDFDMEHTIVHELLHITLNDLDICDCDYEIEERIINTIAKCLIKLREGS